ncbi:SDR family oxidoreductase [Magnetospirillum sulfuroxidans]|uniref:SDR family oxidoreductase n=1 Tax=Magnetospirillum sulfuroxidans TaxID=611300 RepID=A0ABS5I9C9_9PROT|nr:SDR family oxidoreductase [Magnetospirillum sulfuroxidans]MBR9971038.1 SDR family oxidoreductase [Magnetospirillum sulfuroxidans]
MMHEQAGKVALVTGAARGIGAAVAERLARDGFAIIVNYAGSEAKARVLTDKIKDSGGQALAIQADVADAQAVRHMFSAAEAAFGGVDVLVNNAGIMALAAIGACSDDAFDRQIAVNMRGTFNTLREAANHLRDGGRIINFSTSVLGLRLENYGIYAATKAAVEAMTAIMAKEMRGRGITVNAIAPGPTATDLFLDGKSPELIERLAKMAPLERLATPEDIAAAVAFLAGADGGWINGQVLRANGGLV